MIACCVWGLDVYKPMNSQNKIFQNKGNQSDIIIINVNSYLSPKFIKEVALFETLTHTHAQFQAYDLTKLPIFDRKSIFQFRPLLLLVSGINKNIQIKVQMIRIINIGATVICLVKDKFDKSQNRFFPLIIIFPDLKKAQIWCNKCQYLSTIIIYDPYANFKSYYKTKLILARFDSLVVYQSSGLQHNNWNDAKLLANNKFKEKKYKEALILYQTALGMLWDSSKCRDRAILYSNASQSFLDLNLNQNCQQYANVAIIIDKTFIKSYYRKLCSLLQLKQFTKIPPILTVMNRFCSKEQSTAAHERYTRYLANQTGLFNWHDIFIRRVNNFGQYLNSKIRLNHAQKYYTNAHISQYELVAVQKSSLYITEVNNEEYGLMPKFLSKLKDLVDLDSNFFKKIITLPKNKQMISKKEADYMDAVIVQANNYIHCFQSIFMEQISIQICPDYIYFGEKAQAPNCTLLSLNGSFFYFALRDIEPQEPLSADLFNKAYQEPQKSAFHVNKDSQFNSLQFYLKHKEDLLQMKKFKLAIFYLWRAVKEQTNENRAKLMKQLSLIIQLYPLWEIAILILCQLRKSRQFPQRKQCESLILNLFERCFKIAKTQASQIIVNLISQ